MVTVSQSQPSAETGPVARPGPKAEEPAATAPDLGAVRGSLADIDAASAACPVENPRLRGFGYDPYLCPKCRATQSQNCGPYLTALAGLERAVRAALAEPPDDPPPPSEELGATGTDRGREGES